MRLAVVGAGGTGGSFGGLLACAGTLSMGAGLLLSQSLDIAGDEDLAKLDADWRRHIGRPMIKIWVLERS